MIIFSSTTWNQQRIHFELGSSRCWQRNTQSGRHSELGVISGIRKCDTHLFESRPSVEYL